MERAGAAGLETNRPSQRLISTFLKAPSAGARRACWVDLLTALNASRAAAPFLRKTGAGRIVNLGVMGALRAGVGFVPYAASKSGVHRLTEALASEPCALCGGL
jgi:3-oxoacyl-[acyl-carrier protein] reductase